MEKHGQLLAGNDDFLERLSILADPRSRRVLSILLDQSRPLTDRDLWIRTTALEAGIQPSAVSEQEHQQIRMDLYHRCLPKLEAVGLVERHPEGIVAVDPCPLETENPLSLDLRDPDDPCWDAAAPVLARPRRQDLLSIVADEGHLTLEELAAELADRDYLSSGTDSTGEDLALRSTLHHVDLPRLADVGLVEYHLEENTIARTQFLSTFVTETGLDER